MNRESWWGLIRDWGLAFGITCLALVVWRLLTPAPVTEGEAPLLELKDLEGGRYVLTEAKAPVYVVNFWATWCAPCREEIPTFSQFALANPEVEVLGVSVDVELSTKALGVQSKRLGIVYKVLHDPKLVAASDWGVSSYPTTFVLDAHHHVVAMRTGAIDRTTLENLVEQARNR